MSDATAVFEQLQSQLDAIRDTDAHCVENMNPGECWWQGDLGIQFLGEQFSPADYLQCPVPEQLAPGESRGSRHCLAARNVTAYRIDQPLIGYLLHCPEGLEVTHPEHGDITIREPGWYAVRYQRAFSKELKRQRD